MKAPVGFRIQLFSTRLNLQAWFYQNVTILYKREIVKDLKGWTCHVPVTRNKKCFSKDWILSVFWDGPRALPTIVHNLFRFWLFYLCIALWASSHFVNLSMWTHCILRTWIELVCGVKLKHSCCFWKVLFSFKYKNNRKPAKYLLLHLSVTYMVTYNLFYHNWTHSLVLPIEISPVSALLRRFVN